MHIPQNIQIIILYALDNYIKVIKSKKRLEELEFSMIILEQNETNEITHPISDYIISLKYYSSHSKGFWKVESQNALDYLNK